MRLNSGKTNLNEGDYFSVPLSDSLWGVGQILAIPTVGLPKILCSFYSIPQNSVPAANCFEFPSFEEIIAVLFVTPDQLKSRKWPIFSSGNVVGLSLRQDYGQLQGNDFVGVKIIGSSNARELLMAWNGLTCWDDWHNPAYLDSLLLPGVCRPPSVRLKGR